MAATLVEGAFLSASVQLLLEKITSSNFRDFLRNRKLNLSLLDDMETTLLTLQVVLDDAEEKQITKPAVKEWVDKLKDAVYDAEDLLNTIDADSLRCKMEEQPQNKANQVWNFLSSPFNQFYRDINSKMEDLSRRLKQFAQQKDILGLQSQTRRVSHRISTSSLVNESVTVGREEDIEKLKNMLLSDDDDANNNNIGVVTILGMGGIGKTTLAQLLYNNKDVHQHFDLKAWSCVSEDYDAIRVTKTLLQSLTSEVCDIDNLDFLQVQLKKRLEEKKFLFVLDDLWNAKYNDWDNLQAPFSAGKKGSKIIITTRQQSVAKITHTFPIHELPPLTNEECWSLLVKHAFGGEDINGYPSLEEIGRKIAKKCSGLPIAAKTLGGVLRSKVDEEEWRRILNSSIWDLQNNDVMPALHLSYLHLPPHLKRCFAYCAIFPKDYLLDRKHLVLLWMAEGFVQQSQGDQTIEEIGNDYFDELLQRSLIQQDKHASGDQFCMHDLVNDLAMLVSGRSCFRIEHGEIPTNVRHLSFNQQEYDSCKKFERIYGLKCLRSFISLRPEWMGVYCYFTRKAQEDLLPTLKLLRVLSLSGYKNITKLPNSIGNLVQLRYLNLSRTGLERLPDTICTLYHLQTLILSECHELIELPEHIGKLVNLRHLDISGRKLMVMPKQVGRLQNLQTLTCFVVGKQGDGLRVRELGKFPHLQGKLSILKLQNVMDCMDDFGANLKGNEKIEELVLVWGKTTEDSLFEKRVMDQLQPSTKLRKLTINLYGGTSFPNWLGDSSFSNMVFLNISNCDYCLSLPPLGLLPSLRDLAIVGMLELESIGAEFYGEIGGSVSSFQPFPSLEHLKFENMPNWKEWLPFGGEGRGLPFPRLQSLGLAKCPKLRGHLPNHLPSLNEVTVVDCYEMEVIPSVLHWISSIKYLEIQNDHQWFREEQSFRRSASPPSLPKIILTSNSLLRDLTLSYIPSLTSFPTDGLPTSLRSLHIMGCAELTFPPPEICRNCTSLVDLEIFRSCDSLVSFSLDSFPALETLDIGSCANLQSLYLSEVSAQCSSRLQHLSIQNCKRLKSLPEQIDKLTALQSLFIMGCAELAFPPPEICRNHTSLLRLSMFDSCDSLVSFSLDCFPALESLYISGCANLQSLYLSEVSAQCSSRLQYLTIRHCKRLKSFPEQIDKLTALQYLTIGGLPELESFPKGALTPNLQSFCVVDYDRRVSHLGIAEWGLQRLTSLHELVIGGDDVVEALLNEPLLLPTSLVTLSICHLSDMKSLEGNWLQRLTSLKKLHIGSCKLLESLPGDKLPPSLSLLRIWDCPVLEARYQIQSGEHWSKIAHIPVIRINEQVII